MSIVLVGYLAFVAASLLVGARLLAVGLRRRALPEVSLGSGFLLSGGVGFLLMVSPRLAPDLDPGAHDALRMTGQIVTNAGFVGIWVFNVVVFGGGRRLAVAASVAACALLALSLLGAAAGGVEVLRDPTTPWYAFGFLGKLGAFVWAAASGLHHHALQRRRLALGLAEPEVVNRFLLWGLYGVFTTALMLCGLLGSLLAVDGRPPLATSLGLSLFGLACAACMWLAFFPPALYRRRVAAAPR